MEDEKRGACSTCVHIDVDLADPPCAACFKSAIHPAWKPVEEKPDAEEKEVPDEPVRGCETCRWRYAPSDKGPCAVCDGYEFDKWERHEWTEEEIVRQVPIDCGLAAPELTEYDRENIRVLRKLLGEDDGKESGKMGKKDCSTCFWKGRPGILEPCKSCDGYDKWVFHDGRKQTQGEAAGEAIQNSIPKMGNNCFPDLKEIMEVMEKMDKPVYQQEIEKLIDAQVKKGLDKYGVTLEGNVTLTQEQRVEHLEEELIDGLMYCEHLKTVLRGEGITADDYQRAALRTAQVDSLPNGELLLNGVMGLCGEAGECIDLVKKARFQGHELDSDKLRDELGDVAWYLAVASFAAGFNLSEVFERNVEKLKARYPDGFDKARSMNRG